MPFPAHALERIFFDIDITVKNKINGNYVGFHGLSSYQQQEHVITLFPNIFFLLFLHIERVCKSF